MKELIKKLLVESGYDPEGSDVYQFDYFDEEKFVKLIIQDSIETLYLNGYDDAAQCLHDRHFKVELLEDIQTVELNVLAGAEIHSDKGYQECTHSKSEEFAKKRNYPLWS